MTPLSSPRSPSAAAMRPTAGSATAASGALVWLLPLLMLLPSSLRYVGLSSSFTAGTAVAAAALCIVAALFGPTQPRLAHAATIACGVAVAILAHLGFASLYGQVDWLKAFGSILALVLCLVGAAALAGSLAAAPAAHLLKMAKGGVIGFGIIALLGILHIAQPDVVSFGKSVFPFSEPSHLALAAGPWLLFACVTSTPWPRLLYLGAAFIIALCLQNLTLVALLLVVTFICLPPRYFVLFILIVVPAALSQDLTYYTDRLDFSAENENLSTLVFLQGWEMIGEAWERSAGIGLGFQQLGVSGTDVPAADLIVLIFGENLNILDGGFMFAKLVGEFGGVAVILLLGYVRLAARAWKILRQTLIGGLARQRAVDVLAASAVLSYLVEIFVRGAGYFTPTGVLLVASVWILSKSERRAPATVPTGNFAAAVVKS